MKINKSNKSVVSCFASVPQKRGLVGKIFAIIGIVLLIIIAIVGITAYQAYSFFAYIQDEVPAMESDIKALASGDCSKIESIESRMGDIKSKVESRCKNPIIRIALSRIEEIPFNCDNLEEGFSMFSGEFEKIEEACALKEGSS